MIRSFVLFAICLSSSLFAATPATVYIYPQPGSQEEWMSAGKPIARNGEVDQKETGPIVLFMDGHYYNISLHDHSPWCPCKNN